MHCYTFKCSILHNCSHIPAAGVSCVSSNSRAGRSWWETAAAGTSCGRSPSCPSYASCVTTHYLCPSGPEYSRINRMTSVTRHISLVLFCNNWYNIWIIKPVWHANDGFVRAFIVRLQRVGLTAKTKTCIALEYGMMTRYALMRMELRMILC